MKPQEPVTLVFPQASGVPTHGSSSSLPADLLDQARGRVRLLALLIGIAFGLDLALFCIVWVVSRLLGTPVTLEMWGVRPVEFAISGGAMLASLAVYLFGGRPAVSVGKLRTVLLAYQTLVCFIVSFTTHWQYYNETGHLPNLTWVPAIIILFALVMPGTPRQILGGSILAGGMVPLSVGLLDLADMVVVNEEVYGGSSFASALAVFMAYMSARVVYGLGKQVAEARQLGSYQLETRLGQGGMGEVWTARHRLLARPAAIKLIRSDYFDATKPEVALELRSRFEREAQATAELRSPHTVTLFDFGSAADGTFFYVMELLEGLDTETLVRDFGPLPWERVTHILRQACHSLSEAHARGMVHRDIKPANLFLCRYGEELDFVKVLDFGLVKSGEWAGDEQSSLTRDNVVQGTPGYLAPEQALGRASIDGRADLYALGCVAYWLLTGERVFTGETPIEVITHHAHEAPVPPSQRTELEVPNSLEALVLSCLEKEPAARPDSARVIIERLETIEREERTQWTETQASGWWTTHHPLGHG